MWHGDGVSWIARVMCYGLGCGKGYGKDYGMYMAGALVAVSVGRVARVASLVFALTSLGVVVTLAWNLFASWSSSPLFAECSKMFELPHA